MALGCDWALSGYLSTSDMDLSALKALPFGLLIFVAMAWRFFRRRSGQKTARLEYPALASQLQLTYRPPRYPNHSGKLHGELRGFPTLVDPDEQRKLIVRFRGAPRIDFRSYEGPRCPADMTYYTSRSRAVNGFFKTRFVGEDVARRLDAADLEKLLEPFLSRHRGVIREFNITEHGATCVLDYGNPPHIPVDAVATLLPALVDWAELIEPVTPRAPTTEGAMRAPTT